MFFGLSLAAARTRRKPFPALASAGLLRYALTGREGLMEKLIIAGAIVTLIGFALLVWSIVRAIAIRRSRLSDAELRAELQRLMPINMGALLISVIGLMMVIIGLALGTR